MFPLIDAATSSQPHGHPDNPQGPDGALGVVTWTWDPVSNQVREAVLDDAGPRWTGEFSDWLAGIHETDRATLARRLTRLASRRTTRLRAQIRRGNQVNRFRWSELRASQLTDGTVFGVVVDIDRSKRRELRLAAAAGCDPMTGLTNRVEFERQLREQLRLHQQKDGHFAMLFVDLDKFKQINDEHGHLAGDDLIGLVADRMRTCVRREDTVARLGGDEFAVLLRGSGAPVRMHQVAERVDGAFEHPFYLRGIAVEVSASIGCVAADSTMVEIRDVWDAADAAMYKQKRLKQRQIESVSL